MKKSRITGKKNARQVSNGLWLEKARQYAAMHASKHTFVTSDDVLAGVGKPQGTTSVAGAIFRNGRFTKVGYTPSSRVTTHGREISIWRLKR